MTKSQRFPRSLSEVLATLAVLVFLGSIFVQFLSWTVGDDPALLARAESSAVSERLATLRVVPVNETLAVNDSSPYRWILGAGFSESESDGTWVVSTEAVIEFSVEDSSPSAIRLSISPFLSGGAQRKSIEIETSVSRTVVELEDGGKMVALELDGSSRQQVRIRCASLEVSNSQAGTADRRGLCAKLYVVEVVG